MDIKKKLVFCSVFVGLLVIIPSSFASADSGRYFVKSTKSFWKNALGVRHSFENGFTTDLSDFQVKLNGILGLEMEPVKMLQILPDSAVASTVEQTNLDKLDKSEKIGKPQESTTPSSSPLPSSEIKARISKFSRPVPSDQTPWGIETIYNDPKIASTSGGENVKVAVLDTGVALTHPDLKRRIIQCKDFTNFKFPVLDGKCDDQNGHGTHVAGIIAADGGTDKKGIYGVAPEAQLLIYKVCGQNGSCYADDIAMALRTAANQGANIINMSFGSDTSVSLINDAINYATSKGVLPVAAAGNDGPFDASIDYPAAYVSVIAVGAINQSRQVTEWSSRGINSTTELGVINEKDIEFAAPGENIESTYNNGGYVILSGTSMASPFVAGLAAKYWQSQSVDPNPAQATRSFLKSLAVDILPVGEDNKSGFGLPQAPSLLLSPLSSLTP